MNFKRILNVSSNSESSLNKSKFSLIEIYKAS
jgi:hypothetical protein